MGGRIFLKVDTSPSRLHGVITNKKYQLQYDDSTAPEMPVGWVAPLFPIREVLDLDLDSHAEGFMSSSVYIEANAAIVLLIRHYMIA
jgi:hypothetical protein